jgi:hypothetical protein
VQPHSAYDCNLLRMLPIANGTCILGSNDPRNRQDAQMIRPSYPAGCPTQQAVQFCRLSDSTGCPIQAAVRSKRLANPSGCPTSTAVRIQSLSDLLVWPVVKANQTLLLLLSFILLPLLLFPCLATLLFENSCSMNADYTI